MTNKTLKQHLDKYGLPGYEQQKFAEAWARVAKQEKEDWPTFPEPACTTSDLACYKEGFDHAMRLALDKLDAMQSHLDIEHSIKNDCLDGQRSIQVKQDARIKELEKEVERQREEIEDLHSGNRGACPTCEPVGELNQRERELLDRAVMLVLYDRDKICDGGACACDFCTWEKDYKAMKDQ